MYATLLSVYPYFFNVDASFLLIEPFIILISFSSDTCGYCALISSTIFSIVVFTVVIYVWYWYIVNIENTIIHINIKILDGIKSFLFALFSL